ncbi:VTT domain-containing protein [Inhella gelatinilytica]|uniref:VTT domain-containing protein n=1 Tax=Inhella gelatinilytica TaxID=2795030 RepID=A0A931IWE1_9BURK|nr:VTT domain-containing protein [Inhella gelatinilytica]MBH9552269.1 VTT domain-containing protein [Inhella gelatinilytica]
MLNSSLETRLLQALLRQADAPRFPLTVAGVALAATLSMSVPFASLLVAAVLMAPRRWWAIAGGASLGAALGAALLYWAFHHMGWDALAQRYPDLMRSAAWVDATRWLSDWGVWALLAIAALPLPLTPALAFAALTNLPMAAVVAALWLGKLVKYSVYAGAAAHFPQRWLTRALRRLHILDAASQRAHGSRLR